MKNRTYIKKAAVCVLTAGIMAAMLAGCENSSDSNGAKDATAVADTEVTEGNANTSVDYSYTKHVADEGYSEYDETYELSLSDDTNAVFYDITNYSDVRCITNMYKGTYVKTDDSVTFTYQDPDDVDFKVLYIFYLDGDKVTDVGNDYNGQSALVGTYTCSSSENGDMTLTIQRDGNVTLNMNGVDYTGSLTKINERWNLLAFEADSEDSIDWYVDFNGDTFTYEKYSYYSYEDYAGNYKMNGDLGVLELQLDEYGAVTATINVDGNAVDFTGNYYVDEDQKKISSISLYSEEGYSMELYVEDIGEEMLNYSGTVSRPLGAG